MNKETVKIIRYSTQGFKPQYQSNHLENVHYHLHNFNINDFPEHLQYEIQSLHERHVKFYTEHYEDLREGIWFFLDGHKDNMSLNHLKYRVPCWEAEIETDVLVYDCNWEKIVPLTDSIVECFGCYIPKSQMNKIHNIKKRKSKKTK